MLRLLMWCLCYAVCLGDVCITHVVCVSGLCLSYTSGEHAMPVKLLTQAV